MIQEITVKQLNKNPVAQFREHYTKISAENCNKKYYNKNTYYVHKHKSIFSCAVGDSENEHVKTPYLHWKGL